MGRDGVAPPENKFKTFTVSPATTYGISTRMPSWYLHMSINTKLADILNSRRIITRPAITINGQYQVSTYRFDRSLLLTKTNKCAFLIISADYELSPAVRKPRRASCVYSALISAFHVFGPTMPSFVRPCVF